MSISNIVDYINKTPGNTNPSVVKSMVEGEMNSTLEQAKAYTDSQRLGYTEPGKVYTFDGDTTGKVTFVSNGIQYVRIAQEHIDPENITRIVVSMYGNIAEFGRGDFRISWNNRHDSYSVMIPSDEQEVTIIFGYSKDPDMWIFADPNYNSFVVRVEYAETIHTIDPKYLPEGGSASPNPLVLNLTEYGFVRDTFFDHFNADIRDNPAPDGIYNLLMDAAENRMFFYMRGAYDESDNYGIVIRFDLCRFEDGYYEFMGCESQVLSQQFSVYMKLSVNDHKLYISSQI